MDDEVAFCSALICCVYRHADQHVQCRRLTRGGRDAGPKNIQETRRKKVDRVCFVHDSIALGETLLINRVYPANQVRTRDRAFSLVGVRAYTHKYGV